MKPLKSIFLVEDDQDDQMFFTECIEKIKNATLFGVANNGREALDKLKISPKLPDIIFMDINMPRMNGIECLKEITRTIRIKNIPVVMLSTDTSKAQLTRVLGAKAFIIKPTNYETLLTEIEEIINSDFPVPSGVLA